MSTSHDPNAGTTPPIGVLWPADRVRSKPQQLSESEYLKLDTGQLIEFDSGRIEVLPVPTLFHQAIVDFLHTLLKAYLVGKNLGKAFFAPVPVWLWEAKYREPDIFFLRFERITNLHGVPEGADLVMEVMSAGQESRRRDLQEKREDYARAGIAEYWIVDPEMRRITVLALDGDAYRLHGDFEAGQTANSCLLPGFEVEVAAAFAAGEQSRDDNAARG